MARNPILEFKKDLNLSHFTFENLQEAVYWVNSNGTILYVNDTASKMSGYTKDELMSMEVRDLNPSEIVADFKKFWKQLKAKKHFTFEAKHKHKTGYLYDVEITGNYIEFKGQEITCSIVRDIRKKKLEEEMLRTVSEATSGLTGKDFFTELAKHITITLSMRYALITECANEQRTRLRTLCYVDGDVVLENIEYDTADIPCEIIMRGEDFFMTQGVEASFPKEMGIESYIGVPIYSPTNGNIMGHMIAVDPNPITSENNQTSILKIFASRVGAELERMKVEKELEIKNCELNKRLNEIELYHTTMKNLRDQIFWVDKSGKFIRVNDAVSKGSGYSIDELMKMSVFDINPSLTKKEWDKGWTETKKYGQKILETEHKNIEGKLYPVEVTNNFIEYEGTEYFCSSARDIRKRKMEEELLRTVSEQTAGITGEDYLLQLAKFVTSCLNIRYAMVSKYSNPEHTRMKMLSYVERNKVREGFEYDLSGTPCEVVMKGNQFFCANNLELSYPRELGIKSWIAVPIYSPTTGEPIGNIGGFDTIPMTNEQNQSDILKIFAARAGAEIERLEALHNLENANAELAIRLKEIEVLKNQLQAENKYLQEEIKLNNNFEEIISKSKNFHKILQQIEQVASTDATVLIMGESGTGKELLARAIHNISNRSKRALIKINCANLPANLIESELFGHERGAFTGAMERKIGRFELADGGTIFLDEIGELPVELQAKLLRVLQEGEFERLGNPKTMKVNVRVIAATNRNLEDAIAKKEFREDLFYRLNVFPVISPPLRDRKEDIPLLVKHFVKKYEGKMGKVITDIPAKIIDALILYDWPGNIRELENLIERGLILSRGNTLEHGSWIPSVKIGRTGSNGKAITQKLDEVEKEHIIAVLDKTNWKVSGEKGAAKILGLNATTLEARMKKLGIERKK
jgi:PAS domain S-box-containing protein